jgi:hypothetical protein
MASLAFTFMLLSILICLKGLTSLCYRIVLCHEKVGGEASDRRQALQRTARELARDARALQKAGPCTRGSPLGQGLQGEADAGQILAMRFLVYQKGIATYH